MSTPSSGSLRMRPRARLIEVMGDELISDEPVALVELVKNSYDADAPLCEVRFQGRDPDHPEQLVVSDSGLGMDFSTVEKGWFEPGTILKRRFDRSPGGRPLLGAKGIGRFAAARLARTLLLESKTTDEGDGVSVLLDWGQFGDDRYMDEVTIDYQIGPIPEMDRGTRLTLGGLRKI